MDPVAPASGAQGRTMGPNSTQRRACACRKPRAGNGAQSHSSEPKA